MANIVEYTGALKPTSIEQATFEKDLWAVRFTEIPSQLKARFDYDGANNCIYMGFAPKGLAEGANGWLLYELKYDASDNLTEKNICYGNWTDRASYTSGGLFE
jgi:hypothetical protein